MKSTKLYPFERNRYYSGKMLTSADFQAEQTYFNSKRRFINNLMYGAGVVCGCGVFSLDDLSLLVESGVAIDGHGREIVIESSVVKKLSAIEGFESLQSNFASLCLRYKEELVHMVYTPNHDEEDDSKEYEYNRISEGYQLFLMDRDEAAAEYPMEVEFLTDMVLFENSSYIVRLIMPTTVCKGRNIKLVVRVGKLSSSTEKLSYHGIIQTPVFLSPEGEHEFKVDLEDITLAQGEVLDKEYWLAVQNVDILDTTVLLKNGTAKAYIDGAAVETVSGNSVKVMLSGCNPNELVSREIGRMSLEMKNMVGVKDYVRLADLRLVKTDNAYIIEEILEREVKNYIAAPAQDMLRNEYLEYFIKQVDISKVNTLPVGEKDKTDSTNVNQNIPEIATGILQIPLGESVKKGEIYYSGEIMHGLGKGNVYVNIGYENIEEDPALQAASRNTVFGNASLFNKNKSAAVDAETAVKVFNDKGSFMVAVQLKDKVDCLILTYRWIAIKFPTDNDMELTDRYNDKSISADTPTVVMGCGDSHYFSVTYHNMVSCSLEYEMTEPGTGEITPEGVYTAPAKEGVYEIHIYCVDKPKICTYAYAIVKKKGQEDIEK